MMQNTQAVFPIMYFDACLKYCVRKVFTLLKKEFMGLMRDGNTFWNKF